MLFGHYYDCGCKLSQNPNKPSHFPNDSFSFPRPPSLMGLILLILLTLLTLLKSLALLTAWKECVTLYITSPMVPWWGSLAMLRVKYRALRLRGSFLQHPLPPLRSLYVLCVLCVCVCVCVYLCVEITVLTKATVSGSVGPVYRRDFLAPRRARCSEPYVPSKLHFLLGSWVWWRRWSRRRSSRWSSRWRSWWKRRRATTVRRARRLFSSSNSVSYASPMKKTRLAPLTLLCEHFCAIHISVEISP